MSKIFFEFSAGLGPLIRCMPIVFELQKQGHYIKYFGHDESRTHMNEYNFEHIDIAVSACQENATESSCEESN